ncbi:MAG: DUF389 domain-containing protein [Phaeodactylibacter sp.]|nr:DUF389 domain-containing protein [Phaeodactylibacter sp.]
MEKQGNSSSPAPIRQESNNQRIRRGLGDMFGGIWDFFKDLIDLREGMDREGTIINIRNNKRMRGANAWLLMCSIMVASLGLDLNSPAVIIGAMLISPLMSPILGIGLSVGINDREMLYISIQHFAISIAIALITSFIYFKLTPFGDITPEINARTKPTFLDVLIAFFGGVAGIISGSRKDKSNAIPGVAIATALMPPLCVTGFGLATGDLQIMLNSFYLFFLNAVFVALATYLIVRFLDFPHKEFVDPREKTRTSLIVFGISALLIAPSIFILSGVLSTLNQKRTIRNFFEAHFDANAFWEIEENRKTDTLEAKIFLFGEVQEDSLAYYRTAFNALNCQAKLSIIRTEISGNDIDIEQYQQSMRKEFVSMLEAEEKIKDDKDRQIESLARRIDSLVNDEVIFKRIIGECKVLFPDLKEIGYARMQSSNLDTLATNLPTLTVSWDPGKSIRSKRRAEEQLTDFVRLRAGLDTLKLIVH